MKKIYSKHEKYADLTVLAKDLNKGNEDAFDYLFRSRYNRLCNYAYMIIRDACSAEDIVQDIFSAIWQKSDRIKTETTLDSYLRKAVYNRCIDFIKSEKRKYPLSQDPVHVTLREDDPEPELMARLENNIDKLPGQCKRIFTLVAIEGMKYREVADALELSLNTVKTQMKIAYRNLRE